VRGSDCFFNFSCRVLVAKWQEQDCIFLFQPCNDSGLTLPGPRGLFFFCLFNDVQLAVLDAPGISLPLALRAKPPALTGVTPGELQYASGKLLPPAR
jgi:hypothetical protein